MGAGAIGGLFVDCTPVRKGLLLTPTVDHFHDGELLISPVVHRESLKRMGIPPDERLNVGGFTERQRRYLEFHWEAVFLKARVRRE